MDRFPKLDSLDTVELLTALERSDLTPSQVDRLAQFLIAPLHLKYIWGGMEVTATGIARISSVVLFLEDGRRGLSVGVLDQEDTIWDCERYASGEMAVRAFLRAADEVGTTSRRSSRLRPT
jgi:hypothetical protein